MGYRSGNKRMRLQRREGRCMEANRGMQRTQKRTGKNYKEKRKKEGEERLGETQRDILPSIYRRSFYYAVHEKQRATA